jgi:hypothetical protein
VFLLVTLISPINLYGFSVLSLVLVGQPKKALAVADR